MTPEIMGAAVHMARIHADFFRDRGDLVLEAEWRSTERYWRAKLVVVVYQRRIANRRTQQ